jgi:hypothetical protein
MRPYKNGYTPFAWRGTIDWGTGAFGRSGCHMLDVPLLRARPGSPVSALCTPVKPSKDQFPESESVVLKYAPCSMTAKEGLTLRWFDGGQFPDFKWIGLPDGWEGGEQGRNVVMGNGGVILVGERGIMWFPIEGAWSRVFHDGKPVELKPVGCPQSEPLAQLGRCVPSRARRTPACRLAKGGRMCGKPVDRRDERARAGQGARVRRREVRLQEQRRCQRSAPPHVSKGLGSGRGL